MRNKHLLIIFFILALFSSYSWADNYSVVVKKELDFYEANRIGAFDSKKDLVLKKKKDKLVSSDTSDKKMSVVDYKVKPDALEEYGLVDILELKDMDIIDVLKLISQKSNINIIAGNNVKGKVTIFLKDVKLNDALRIILDSNKLAYKVEDDIVRVMPAKEFENKYGYKFGARVQTRIVHLLFSNVSDMVSLLNQIKSPNGKVIPDAKSNSLILIDTPERINMMHNLICEIDIAVETKVFSLSYAKAVEVEGKIGELLTANVGHVRSDERSNKIIITDTNKKIKEIENVIKAFDVSEREVSIEAKIVQIVLSDEHKYGVDWQAIVSKYQGLDFHSNFDKLSSSDKGGTLNIATLDDDDYTVLIEALESTGNTNILSSPSITTINNKQARILVGSSEPYVTTTTTTPSSGPTTTAESITFLDVGVKLYVTPTIHKDDYITMNIQPEVSSVTKTITTSNNNVIPVVETSEVETSVRVKDGVTIVIGGLIKEERIESQNKVPLLGDVPVVGHAFRNSDSLVRKTEIIIFLRPKIITGDLPTRRAVSSKPITNF